MAYLSAVSSLDNVIQYEIDDPTQTIGGPGGGANAQAQALLNRTKYIYDNFFNRLTQTLDNIADGTSYARLQKAKADALNAGTQVAPTAAGAADANAIAAATGSTLGARLETLTGQAVKITSLTAGADWANITDIITGAQGAALHIIKMYDTGGYTNFWIVASGRDSAPIVIANSPSPHQTLTFQKIYQNGTSDYSLQCKAPTYNTTITCKTISANP